MNAQKKSPVDNDDAGPQITPPTLPCEDSKVKRLSRAKIEGIALQAGLVGERLHRGIIDAPTATIELRSLTQLMIGGL